MMQQRNTRCPSVLRLDQWLAEELPDAERADLESHVAGCAPCQSRYAELVESRRNFAREAPSFAELASSPRRAHFRWRAGFRWRSAAPLLAAAAALALAIGQPWQVWGPFAEESSNATRIKGGSTHLTWVVRRGEHVFAGRPDLELRAGDALRFSVSAREPVYAALLGLDPAGRWSVYHPEQGTLARLEAGHDQPLPVAIELDAAPGDEQLYAVFCRSAAPLASVKEALMRSPDTPNLPAGCSHERHTLHKGAR
jgi:hypothetical protein